MRHFWGTTPARRLSGTTTPHATTSTSSVRQHTSMAGATPVTRHCTRYGALHPLRGATPVTGRHTPYEALHPIRGTTPHTRQCTRYEAVHPLRGTAPDQKGCNAYRSGAAPPITRTNAESARRGPGCAARGRRQGLAGQRVDAPSAARGADGSRAGRRPRAHKADRPGTTAGGPPPTGAQSRPARNNSGRAAAHGRTKQPGPQPQLSRRSRWRRRGRPRR